MNEPRDDVLPNTVPLLPCARGEQSHVSPARPQDQVAAGKMEWEEAITLHRQKFYGGKDPDWDALLGDNPEGGGRSGAIGSEYIPLVQPKAR